MSKQIIFFLFSLFICSSVRAQSDTTFYKDIYLSKQCSPSKANYASIVTTGPVGSPIKEVRQLKHNILIRAELISGEQTGIWHYRDKILNFDFDLNYTDTACNNAIYISNRPFEDNMESGYTAPVIEAGTLSNFIGRNTAFPIYAIENDIQGKVMIRMIITSAGTIQHIAVVKSAHVSLDKEAVRVMQQIKLSSPPKINGKPATVCVTFPFIFQINR